MRPFDLEAAKLGEPLVTRDGRPAKFIGHSDEAKDQAIAAAINGEIETFTKNGGWWSDDAPHHPNDLFMAPRKVTYWLNIYAAPYVSYCYPSKEEADRCAAEYRIGEARPVEIEL